MLSTSFGFTPQVRFQVLSYTQERFCGLQPSLKPLFGQRHRIEPEWLTPDGRRQLIIGVLVTGALLLASGLSYCAKGFKMPTLFPSTEERAKKRLEQENRRFGRPPRYERSDDYYLNENRKKSP